VSRRFSFDKAQSKRWWAIRILRAEIDVYRERAKKGDETAPSFIYPREQKLQKLMREKA